MWRASQRLWATSMLASTRAPGAARINIPSARLPTRPLRWTLDVLQIVVVFLTNIFEQLRARHDTSPPRRRKRFGVGAGIVDRHLDRHVPQICAPITLDGVELF